MKTHEQKLAHNRSQARYYEKNKEKVRKKNLDRYYKIKNENINNAKNRNGKQRCVYFIKNSTGHVKIGISLSAKHRLRQLQHANSEKLEILEEVYVADASSMELKLHSLFEKSRMMGEWFTISPSNVRFIASLIRDAERFKDSSDSESDDDKPIVRRCKSVKNVLFKRFDF